MTTYIEYLLGIKKLNRKTVVLRFRKEWERDDWAQWCATKGYTTTRTEQKRWVD